MRTQDESFPALSLRQLRYFVAVAETGQVKAASEYVHVSASAITDSMKALEGAVGTRLLNRHRKGMSLTRDGQRFLQHAIHILDSVSNSIHSFHSDPETAVPLSGRLRVGASVAVTGFYLATPLARFRREYPGIEVELIERERKALESEIDAGEIDIAVLITSNVCLVRGRRAETLLQSRRSLWCSAQHRFATMDEVTIADICREHYIQLDIDEADRNTAEIWQIHGVRPVSIFRTESTEAVRSLVASNQGVAILTELSFRPWSLEGVRLISKPISEPIPTMDLGLVWASAHSRNPCVRAFRDYFRRQSDSSTPRRPWLTNAQI